MEQVREVRSLLPSGVMALNATATKHVRLSVSHTLGMRAPAVYTLFPCKQNILYSVSTVGETFQPLAKRIKNERESLPRIIVYCQSYGVYADIYLMLTEYLGTNGCTIHSQIQTCRYVY